MRCFWVCYGEYRGRRAVKPFLRYLSSRYQDEIEAYAYRVYSADCLFNLNRALGIKIQKRYSELLQPVKTDNRTGDEIAADIIKRMGLEEVEENGLDDPAD